MAFEMLYCGEKHKYKLEPIGESQGLDKLPLGTN